ncbi:Retinaldehyde-binding protein 1 [Orchesella cincta]|uniref:Retinaldehyde-binding protein 1 n=1 Tax=Orchesella cincta TaxID=48709 RepID=A0A1D2M624_ORCCI|nr:Retinaldehyde-binding protein 1 [Orchesella cincta]
MGNFNKDNGIEDGIKQMRELYQAFQDEAVLVMYLIGRKYRPVHAFTTLRSYAEMRFDKYPELFPATLPPKEYLIHDNQPIFGILKGRDSKGRRIAFFQIGGWDTAKCSIDDLAILALPVFERALRDQDCLNNGLIFVQETSGATMAHAKQHTLRAILRFINIYWYSFPLKLKGVYFVNVPSFCTYIYAMIKPFLPKKLKERLLITTTSRGVKDVHQRISPDILPKILGGDLETWEAIDTDFIDFQSSIYN